MFSDAPSQVAPIVHPCLVERSHGLNCDRHKQVGLAEYSILLVFLSAAASAAAPGVWDVIIIIIIAIIPELEPG